MFKSLILPIILASLYTLLFYQSSYSKQLEMNKEISIIAPARGDLDKSVIDAIKVRFKALGFKVHIPNDLFKEQLFCSHSDHYRATHLVESLTDAKSDIIWPIRGGYGSARILPALYKLNKPKREKIVIGYSDVTVLHLFLSQIWGWKTIHGPVAKDLVNTKLDPNNFKILFKLLNSKDYTVKIPIFEQLNKVKFDKIEGPLGGGNLTLVQTSIATPWQLQSKGKIIFLEERNEAGYKIDRMLEHLLTAGVLDGARAVVFGDFIESKGQDTQIMSALNRFAKKVKFPVFKTNYFGHGYHNYPLVYNAIGVIAHSNEGMMLKYQL